MLSCGQNRDFRRARRRVLAASRMPIAAANHYFAELALTGARGEIDENEYEARKRTLTRKDGP